MGPFFGIRSREIAGLLEETAREWNADNAPRLGAAVAFYTLLSLAPLLIAIVGVGALVFGRQAVGGQLAWELDDMVGRVAAKAIQGIVEAGYRPGAGIAASVLSVVTSMVGATSVVMELRDDLNLIWRVPATSESAFRAMLRVVKERFYSFALVLAAGFLLLASLILSAWIAALGRFSGPRLPAPELLLHIGSFLISFVVITLLFAAIYKTLPDVPLQWSDVVVGASVTSLLFTAGKQLIALYLGKAGFTSVYGAAGSLVVLLVWIYYSAQLFFVGAEFTKVYTKRFGSHLLQVAQKGHD